MVKSLEIKLYEEWLENLEMCSLQKRGLRAEMIAKRLKDHQVKDRASLFCVTHEGSTCGN